MCGYRPESISVYRSKRERGGGTGGHILLLTAVVILSPKSSQSTRRLKNCSLPGQTAGWMSTSVFLASTPAQWKEGVVKAAVEVMRVSVVDLVIENLMEEEWGWRWG